ncbi:glycoside hydrolase family 16 protein [Gymnopus androsaceus JB14]|uniref:endo-1,3(4)-beta-glucanase n=1 Tax=Gymnopus androsaceus JB14 TaxID=1447944 RepID=A0A6A4HVS0_9AGAR|nr:glycoside hydrolase family 16 protein [Gymnopus androsaceus JB14]
MNLSLFELLTSLLFPLLVKAAVYKEIECYIGQDFLDPEKFTFFSDSDPTHGRVNYVNATVAKEANLAFVSDSGWGPGSTFIARADYTTVLDPDGPGRNSVRMSSNQFFNSSVVVIDLQHMPQGCGTWPAIWTLGNDWPQNGEIDIVEGVNNQLFNQATLHTNPNCTMPATGRPQTGTSLGNDCDVNANFNEGCGVAFDNGTFGPGFNDAGGGWFAMERTLEFIQVWFWPRASRTVPSVVRNGSPIVETQNWGTPQAYFPNTQCDLATEFGPNQIIFDLTLCGDWAGQDLVYAASGCPSTCTDFVNNNPEAFKEAYFEFNSIRVYQPRQAYNANPSANRHRRLNHANGVH